MASRLRLGLAKLLGSETPPPSPSPVEGRAARTPPPAVQHLAQPVGARLTNNAEWDGQAICQAAFDADAQAAKAAWQMAWPRSEEHTSELQSPNHHVCRLLLQK